MKFDSGHAAIGVPIDAIVDAKVVGEPLAREKAELRQHTVERRDVVSLRQEQVVAIGIGQPFGRNPQHALVQMHEEISAGERGADEATAARGHADDVLAHRERERFQRCVRPGAGRLRSR
jgi:hypothetical protein